MVSQSFIMPEPVPRTEINYSGGNTPRPDCGTRRHAGVALARAMDCRIHRAGAGSTACPRAVARTRTPPATRSRPRRPHELAADEKRGRGSPIADDHGAARAGRRP